MAKGARPRVKVPKTAAVGETITIKTLIKHKMESGQRRDEDGNIIPRSMLLWNLLFPPTLILRLMQLYQRQVNSFLPGTMMMGPYMKQRSP